MISKKVHALIYPKDLDKDAIWEEIFPEVQKSYVVDLLQELSAERASREEDLKACLTILEKANIAKVSDNLHWANVISEARCFLDGKLNPTPKGDL